MSKETMSSQDANATSLDPLAALGGEWSMVSCVRDGEPVPQAYVRFGKRVAKGNEVVVTTGPKQLVKATFAIDPLPEPKTIDYVFLHGENQGQSPYGIYELEGDQLKFCFSAPSAARPTDFTTRRGDGKTVTVWRLVKR
jgi:uncharacterized protein (TIGR03067 family)